MSSQLDSWIDAEQRYAEDAAFAGLVHDLRTLLASHNASMDDARDAVRVLTGRQEAERRRATIT